MRISGGQLRGREFTAPNNKRTHPMGERVRGGLFNTLGELDGLTVLDAFAGSGALSFEAVSRGALKATAIESDHQAQHTIKDNIASLGLSGQVQLIKANAGAWFYTSDEIYDLVLLDPPYDNTQANLLNDLAGRVKYGGIVVISLPPQVSLALAANYHLIQIKNYGDAAVHFFKREA